MTKQEEIGEVGMRAALIPTWLQEFEKEAGYMPKQEEIINMPLVMGRFFERPKCKPWDIVKGRRLRCCHGLGEHAHWCLEGIKTITIPKFSKVSMGDL